MNKLKQPKNIAALVSLVLVVGAAAILVFNQGFRFAYYHPSFAIQITSEDSAAVLDEYSFYNGVSRVERDNSQLILQGVDQSYVDELVSQIQAREDVQDTSVAVIDQVISLGVNQRAVYGLTATLIIMLVFSYFTSFRRISKKGTIETVLGFLLELLGLYVGMFVSLGLLSLASSGYELTQVSFLGLGTAFIWGIIIVQIGLTQAGNEGSGDLGVVNHMIYSVKHIVTSNSSTIIGGWIIVGIGLTVGLGSRFLFDGILLVLMALIVSMFVATFPETVHRAFLGTSVFIQTRGQTRSRQSNTKKLVVTDPDSRQDISDTVAKKQKSPRKKSRRRNR